MSFDPYKELNVDKSADEKEIKRAYRKQAQKYHPDKNQGNKEAEEKFKKVNAAYEVLSDPQKKSQYDQFGSMGGQGFGGQGFGGQGFDFNSFGGEGFADIFDTFFGGAGSGFNRRSQGGPKRGNDRELVMTISFEDSYFGVEKTISVDTLLSCDFCKGNGAEPGTKIKTCVTCGGTGQIKSVRSTILGQVATTRVCDVCHGQGKVPEKKCGVCHGTKRAKKAVKHNIKIPSGIEDGATIRLTGKSDAGVDGGPAGDLYIHVRVRPSVRFKRIGDDIHLKESVDLLQAVLGDEVTIKTLDGDIKVKVSAGTQNGKILKLSGHGFSSINSSQKGDLFVEINVAIPNKLSSREKALYKELADEKKLDLKGGKKGLFF